MDAEPEHALFERYAAAAQGERPTNGRITLLVSHRFSTVRMGRSDPGAGRRAVVEAGSHEELMAAGGQYAELYEIQASAYR